MIVKRERNQIQSNLLFSGQAEIQTQEHFTFHMLLQPSLWVQGSTYQTTYTPHLVKLSQTSTRNLILKNLWTDVDVTINWNQFSAIPVITASISCLDSHDLLQFLNYEWYSKQFLDGIAALQNLILTLLMTEPNHDNT